MPCQAEIDKNIGTLEEIQFYSVLFLRHFTCMTTKLMSLGHAVYKLLDIPYEIHALVISLTVNLLSFSKHVWSN